MESRLKQVLGPSFLVYWNERSHSTNTELKELLRTSKFENGIAGVLLGTEFQYGGRGTRGRSWSQSAPGRDIALSFAFRLPPPSSSSLVADPRLTMLVGVVAARALERHGIGMRLKWPNDLMHGDPPKKLGGILCEMTKGWVICGMGLNVNSTLAELSHVGPGVTSLSTGIGRQVDREELTANLALGLIQLAGGARTGNSQCPVKADSLLQEWKDRDCTGGSKYSLLREGSLPVVARRVDLSTGELICEDESGKEWRVVSYTDLAMGVS